MIHLTCKNCGATADGPRGDPTDVAPSEHCDQCPPWVCDDCGQVTDVRNPCPCWISLEGMALADIKAVFAASDLSIGRGDR